MSFSHSIISENYYKHISYEEAWDILFENMSSPPIINQLRKKHHDEMLKECVKRNPAAIEYVKMVIRQVLQSGPYQVDNYTEEEAINLFYQDMYGLGIIEPLVEDPGIQEVWVNGPDNIWYEKDGVKRKAEGIRFKDMNRLRVVIDRCAGYTDKEVHRKEAFVQTTLADGSRIYIAVPPVARVPYLNYRKFTVFSPSEESYLRTQTLTKQALEVLKLFPRYRVNIMIIGPQNSGKTTLLSFLTDYYPDNFRIGVLESPEFETTIDKRRPSGNVFMLKTDKNTGVSELDIFIHALRFSADVIVMPEARGAEIEEVIKVNRRGNGGTIATMHSISPYDVVDDISLMFTETGKNYQPHLLKRMIAKSLDIVITTHHAPDGSRKVINIAEVDYDDEKQNVTVNEIFAWDEGLRQTQNVLSDNLLRSMVFHGAKPEELQRMGLMKP